MQNKMDIIRTEIEKYPEYKTSIFEQGFILTNRKLEIIDNNYMEGGTMNFPFYNNWREVELYSKYHLYIHVHQKAYVYCDGNATYFLIGHAYNPFSMIHDENEILRNLSQISAGKLEDGLDVIDCLTGIFVLGLINQAGEIFFCSDFCSLRSAYYGKVNNNIYLCSHEEIVSCIEELQRNSYSDKLEHYRWYHLYGEGLPGDTTHYKELSYLLGNTYVRYSCGSFTIHRMWPRKELKMCFKEQEYNDTVSQIAEVMSNTMDIIAQKWSLPAISSTGGRDSKGSVAASLHCKDLFQYYSYNSQYAEKVDCDAAEKLCSLVGLPHKTYIIPLEKETYPEYDLVKAILSLNSNRINFNHNDIMKRIYFRKDSTFDVEVKSWGSEIGRARYFQKYGVRKLQSKCTGRKVNATNNIFALNPMLMYETDKKYEDYLTKTQFNEHVYNYEWSDIIFIEMRWGRWGSNVICCEDMFSHDITIPYDNRRLGELMLSIPLEKRINDQTHIDFTKKLSDAIGESDIHVHDVSHDKKRLWFDKVYYFITCYRPF